MIQISVVLLVTNLFIDSGFACYIYSSALLHWAT